MNNHFVFSAKYSIVLENGNETWGDFDIYSATEMPAGKLYVFDCRIGAYTEVFNLAEARDVEDAVRKTFAVTLSPISARTRPVEDPELFKIFATRASGAINTVTFK